MMINSLVRGSNDGDDVALIERRVVEETIGCGKQTLVEGDEVDWMSPFRPRKKRPPLSASSTAFLDLTKGRKVDG